MYENFFGLREKPFSITPNPRFLFLSQQHREGLAHLVYGTDETGSFAMLTGEIGTGKTTLSRFLLEQVPDDVHIALILNPMQTPLELLKSICDEFKISYPVKCDSRKELVDALNVYLLQIHSKNERGVVMIDEAQNLDIETLEQIRLLTNLETGDHKLLKIILIGQPELRDLVARPELKQLSQRITARYHLPPLNRKETGSYIRHRLKVADGHPAIFTKTAIDALYKLSDGVPRLINIFAERALLGGYAKQQPVIGKRLIKTAANELLGVRGKWNMVLPSLLLAASVSFALAGIALAGWAFFSESKQNAGTTSSSVTYTEQKESIDNQIPSQPGTRPDKLKNLVSLTPNEEIKNQNEPANQQNGNIHIIQKASLGELLKTSGGAEEAYAALFASWGENYQSQVGKTTCEIAREDGLECLYSSSGVDQLMSYNLPAILELKDNDGKRKLAMIQSAQGQNITLLINGKSYETTLNELNKVWDRQFLLFWRLPPGRELTLRKGMKGPSITWLADLLSNVSDAPFKTSSFQSFDQSLYNKLIQFQQSNKLQADGIAGADTLISLATHSAINNTPTLAIKGGRNHVSYP